MCRRTEEDAWNQYPGLSISLEVAGEFEISRRRHMRAPKVRAPLGPSGAMPWETSLTMECAFAFDLKKVGQIKMKVNRKKNMAEL